MHKLFNVFHVKYVLWILYFIFFILLCCTQTVTLFQSPVISFTNVKGSRLVNIDISTQLFGQGISSIIPLDLQAPGANASIAMVIKMWHADARLEVILPYGLPGQVIKQPYYITDIPCNEFRSVFKSAQTFSLLAIFLGFITLVLSLSVIFSRLLLPVLWFCAWLSVVMTSGSCCCLLRLMLQQSCTGTPDVIPPFVSIAIPEGGFVLLFICMVGYLLTAVVTVFV